MESSSIAFNLCCILEQAHYECPYRDKPTNACPFLHKATVDASGSFQSLTDFLPAQVMTILEKDLNTGTEPLATLFSHFQYLTDLQNYTFIDIASEESPVECSICMEVIPNCSIGILQKCNHYFCFKCIVKWCLAIKRTSCPLCRTDSYSIAAASRIIPTGTFRSVVFAYNVLRQYILCRVELEHFAAIRSTPIKPCLYDYAA